MLFRERFIPHITIADNRIRRKIPENSIRDLAEDIAKNGLYHPIVINEIDNKIYLVAGERRLRAIELLYKEKRSFTCAGTSFPYGGKMIPCQLLKDLPESVTLEIELHENLMRTDLDWRDVTSARAKLHELRAAEAEAKGKDWTVKDTAKELSETSGLSISRSQQAVADANIIAPHLDDPALKNVKSEAEAKKILWRKTEGEFRTALEEQLKVEGNSVEGETSSTNALNVSMVVNADFREQDDKYLIPYNSFDLIIADPPYGIGADTFGDAAKQGHGYLDDRMQALELAKDIMTRGLTWLHDEGHMFMFCDIDLFLALKVTGEKAGWRVFRTPLIWQHPSVGHIPWGGHYWRREYDLILYAVKGGAPLAKLHSDVLTVMKERSDDSGHGARKPPDLYAMLMQLTCLPGSRVIDPCCGSGPVFPAAEQEHMTAWGFEIDEEIYKSAVAELGRTKEKHDGK